MFEDETLTREFETYNILYDEVEDGEEVLLNSLKYAFILEKKNLVREGIVFYLNRLGYNVEYDNVKEIRKALKMQYEKLGICENVEGSIELPRTVKNWIDGDRIDLSPTHRGNLYNLCIALELSLEETAKFFLKRFLTYPFNYKSVTDAIYFYSLKNRRSFPEIKELINRAESLERESKENIDTIEVYDSISEIHEDETLLAYLKKYSFNKKQQFETAYNEIQIMLEETAILVDLENRINYHFDRDYKYEKPYSKKNGVIEVNYELLYKMMFEFDYNRNDGEGLREALPDSFKKNFPKGQYYNQIKNRTASADTLRRMLVILSFYNFYAGCAVRYCYGNDYLMDSPRKIHDYYEYLEAFAENVSENYEDFYAETSGLLGKCGFVQMYRRNPFDWIVLYCAKSTDPLNSFKTLLLEDSEIQTETVFIE